MTSLFISFGGQDRVKATQIRDRLRGEGYEALFLDFDPSDGIPAGRRWERELYLQLRKSDGVVFLASGTSVQSRWCFAEVSLARSLGRPVFPVRIEGDAWLELLADAQWADLADGESAFTKLWRGLRRAGLNPADSFSWDPARSPFPGLEPFERQDAAVFFGRDQEITRLLDLLQPTLRYGAGRFVAIIGPSGSGKSSLLRAGLLPRLERSPEHWVVLPALLPGRQPIRNLAHSFARAFDSFGRHLPIEEVTDRLGDGGLAQLGAELHEVSGSRNVLVVIDQAEELITRSGAEEQQAFLRMLRAGLHDDSPIWAVATMRSEFLSSAPDRAGLAEAIDDSLVVEPLSRARLPEVIERPAGRAGLDFAVGLVQRIVEETTGGDALPLLACTLQQLYERVGPEGTVTFADYAAIGGVVGALHRQADRVSDELTRRGNGVVLPTLLRLASIDRAGEPTRRRVRRDALRADENAVVQAFVDARLLVSRGPTVEVAHEALLRQWTPLRHEIDAAYQALRLRSEVERLAADWERSGHDESYLLRGGRLATFEEWAEKNPGDLGPLDQQFLLASQTLAHRELVVAQEQQRYATSRSLLYQAESLRNTQAGMSLLFGIAAMDVHPSQEARASLVTTLIHNHYVATLTGHAAALSTVTFSPDGRTMATGARYEPGVLLWDVTGVPRRLSAIDVHNDAVWVLLFSPDGRVLATGGPDSTVVLWDVVDPARPRRLAMLTDNDLNWVSSAAFSPDGGVLLTGHWDNSDGGHGDKAVLWDVTDRSRPRRLSTMDFPLTGPVHDVAVSGTMAATGHDDGSVMLWNISDPAVPCREKVLTGHVNSVWAVAFSPDGTALLTGGTDRTAILWDIANSSPLATLTGHTSGVRAVAFGPDGHTVATGSWDHTAILWDIAVRNRPVRLDTLGGHREPLSAMAFSPDGRRIATASSDRTAVLWDVAVGARPTRIGKLTAHTDDTPALAVTPDGSTIITGSRDGTAILWRGQEPVTTLTAHTDTVFAVAVSPDGRSLLTGSLDATAILWDLSGTELARLTGHAGGVMAVAFSPDGATVAIGDEEATTTLWDVTSARRLAVLTGHRWDVRAVPFTPDGRIMITGGVDGVITVWNVSDREDPRRLTTLTDDASIYAGVFSPDGQTLAVAQEDQKTTLWDMSDPLRPNRFATLRGQASSVYTVGFSHDGNLLCTGGYDRTAILWDVTDRRRPRELATMGDFARPVHAVAFLPDRPVLAIGGDDSPALWDIAHLTEIVARPAKVAREAAGRELSHEEWESYAPDLPYPYD
ncbi:TIR domain-containing protein [Streptomyces cyaneus]|uniref:nSTAND1 domain-containing NTPase n=1 Tax=Streptomyces cyaneus TaxID=1904 RepID=UPI000FF899D8|nr:TIR domain-containing protein [Streptomyces cyaneus]